MDRLTGLIFLPLAIIAAVWFSTPITTHNQGLDSDGDHYAAMALRDPRFEELAHIPPYCWRPLTPWLVSLVAPSDPQRLVPTMRVLNILPAWVTLAALYFLLRRSGLAAAGCILGVLLYAGVFWTIKFSFFSPAYIDHTSQALLMLALLAAAAQRWWWVVFIVALAAAQKETIVAALPVLVAWRWRSTGLHTAAQRAWAACMILAPLLIHATIRAIVATAGKYSAIEMLLSVVSTQLADPAFWTLLVPELSVGLGAMLFILIANARSCAALLRAGPHWALMMAIGIPLLFAGVEKARLLLPTLPAVVFLCATLLERAWNRGMTGRAWVGLTLLAHFYLGHHLEPMNSIDEYFTRMTPLHGLQGRDPTPELIRVAIVAIIWILSTLLLQPFTPPKTETTAVAGNQSPP